MGQFKMHIGDESNLDNVPMSYGNLIITKDGKQFVDVSDDERIVVNDVSGKEDISNKGVASGYMPLDENGLVPTTHLAGFVDKSASMIEYYVSKWK